VKSEFKEHERMETFQQRTISMPFWCAYCFLICMTKSMHCLR